MVYIKTLIELFDECQLENIVAGLRFRPEKIIFVGFNKVVKKKRGEALEKFFKQRGVDALIEYRIVSRYDFENIVLNLNEILDENEDCVFDLTGGKELVLAAMGAVSFERNIPMFQFNIRTGNFIRIKNCDEIEDTEKSIMTIDECVELNGGVISYDEIGDFDWELNDDFKSDIEKIWDICKINSGLWNRQSCSFENFEKFGQIDDNLTVTVNIANMKNLKQDVLLNSRIIKTLLKHNLIFDYSLEGDILKYKYKNEQIRQCISKAGNILELYIYMLTNEISSLDPAFYDDIDIGVFIDWDGVIHKPTSKKLLESEIDTKNEVDIMLMRDLVPIFISCKNGEVHKEALYELETVAERFGGEYSKKILIATYDLSNTDSGKYIVKRAKDMNIELIEGIGQMSREKLIQTLKKRAV